MVDPVSIAAGIQALRGVAALFKEAKDLIPDESKRQQLESKLEAAERELRTAEADTAKSLGHELCQCEFPPAIMTKRRSERAWTCPNCGDKYEPPGASMRLVRS